MFPKETEKKKLQTEIFCKLKTFWNFTFAVF